MSEIERLAKALRRYDLERHYQGYLKEDVPFELIDKTVEATWRSKTHEVRVVLKALAEPSEAAIKAGTSAGIICLSELQEDLSVGQARPIISEEIFIAMINHILQEGAEHD